MYEFRCGSPVCRAHFSAPSRDELMREVMKHVRVTHRVPEPSKSLVAFLEENTIHEVAYTRTAG